MENLSVEWENLCKRYSKDELLIRDWFNRICECYESKNRYYHNLKHISSMMESIKLFEKETKDLECLLFATWFHDVVYEVKNSNNEEKSAEFGLKVNTGHIWSFG